MPIKGPKEPTGEFSENFNHTNFEQKLVHVANFLMIQPPGEFSREVLDSHTEELQLFADQVMGMYPGKNRQEVLLPIIDKILKKNKRIESQRVKLMEILNV